MTDLFFENDYGDDDDAFYCENDFYFCFDLDFYFCFDLDFYFCFENDVWNVRFSLHDKNEAGIQSSLPSALESCSPRLLLFHSFATD